MSAKKTRRSRERTQKNLFYVAHPKIAKDVYSTAPVWTHPTLAKAIAHAKEIMERDHADVQLVVKIIRVVRRPKPPIRMEVV